MRPRVQAPCRAQTAMGFGDRSLKLCTCLGHNAPQSGRCIAMPTGLATRSVHRLTQAMERRTRHPESWVWETADGRHWLIRLVVAALYPFGLPRGVGLAPLRALCPPRRLETPGGC